MFFSKLHFALHLSAAHKERVNAARCILFSEHLKQVLLLLHALKAVAVMLLLVLVHQMQ